MLPESGLRPGDDLATVDPAGPAHVARVRLGEVFTREERLALVAPPGSVYRYTMTVPAAGRLRFGLGVLDSAAKGGAVQMQVRIGKRGAVAEPILDRKVAAEVPGRWHDEELDLAAWGGQEVTLELAALAGASEGLLGAWSSPLLSVGSSAGGQNSGTVGGVGGGSGAKRPNIVWISLDTLRADHLGTYGYERPTSPNLDAFAARSLRFDWAISQAPWTRPSHRSMLTGVYPASRGGLDSPMIGEVLYRAGYQTFAVTGGGQVDSTLGFDRGFEIYRVDDWIHQPSRIVEWVRSRSERPYFLFLHCYETHEPYTHTRFAEGMPSGRLAGEFSKEIWNRLRKRFSEEEMRYAEALYDGDIAYTDARIGEFFSGFEGAGELADSIIIVTSDHGEQFWEHGSWGHGQNLHDHQIHVPLLVFLPESVKAELALKSRGKGKGQPVTQGAIEDQVELIDLYPTLLELIGVGMDGPVNGRSLVSVLAGQGSLPDREAFAEHTNIKENEQKALRTPRYKFMVSIPRKSSAATGESYELFDLKRDPGEQKNLAPGLPAKVVELRAKLGRIMDGSDTARDEEVPADIDEALREQLKALGYIGN
ncbi:MAG: sulfatase-like hydrolase/transferase [Thermoanaerobaculia bacterium]|nr:sulfatase-like hydrolase/transferase [Thermoanaerobaculia bacterium]